MLEGEIDAHLGYDKHKKSSDPNSRNGKTSKTIQSDYGESRIGAWCSGEIFTTKPQCEAHTGVEKIFHAKNVTPPDATTLLVVVFYLSLQHLEHFPQLLQSPPEPHSAFTFFSNAAKVLTYFLLN